MGGGLAFVPLSRAFLVPHVQEDDLASRSTVEQLVVLLHGIATTATPHNCY